MENKFATVTIYTYEHYKHRSTVAFLIDNLTIPQLGSNYFFRKRGVRYFRPTHSVTERQNWRPISSLVVPQGAGYSSFGFGFLKSAYETLAFHTNLSMSRANFISS